jgi:glycine/D-amino acid oxidase-like deaminating enzyme
MADMHVVVCGGGVIGASIAYFLGVRGIAATIVERTGVACAASGKSGGFLARDWCDGTPLEALARRSFDLHAELAERLGNAWGYRRLVTWGGVGGHGRAGRRAGAEIGWLSDTVAVTRALGSPETTAQVHPAAFTAATMRAAEAHGATLRLGQVTGIAAGDGRVTGVEVDGETIPADAVIVAMGPWSVLAAAWLPLPPVYGLKGHSIVFDTADRVPAEAAFVDYREANGEVQGPELFPRPDGTTYVCGMSSESPLPIDPVSVAPDDGAIERLHAMCADMSPVLADAKVLRRQACFRPVTRDGLPLIGRVAGIENAYVATGHSVWGILNAPATGEAMAELIAEGAARSVDLSPFEPSRLRPLDPRQLRVARPS